MSNILPLSALALTFTAAISGSACSTSSSSTPQASAGTTTSECAPSAGAAAKTSAALCMAGTPAASPGSLATGGNGGTISAKTPSNAGTPASAAAGSPANAGPPRTSTAGTSGASGHAGATTAGSPSGAGASAANGCNATLCEDFESSSALDTTRWQTVSPMCSGTGKLALDSTQAHSGTNSVRVDGAGGFCNHVFLSPAMSLFPTSDPLFVRFYVRISTAFTQSHVTMLAMHDEHDMHDLRMGGQSEILMWNRESDDATLPELSPTGIAMSAMPATNTWLCVEFSVDGKNGELHTWLDGNALAGLTVEGDATPDVDSQWKRKADWNPQLSDVRFGWESYGNDANTMWFDDLAIGSSRIGCM